MASEYNGDTEDIATRVMYELLGRRWVFPYMTTTETVHMTAGQSIIVLHGRPVVEVESVTITGSDTQLGYELQNKHRIRLTTPPVAAGFGALPSTVPRFSCAPGSVDVRYTYGAKPPVEIEFAIEVLGGEMRKAMEQDDTCRLPQRVTSVTRNGMSMTVLDSQDFLDDGRTGIEEVDAALARFNPGKAKRPARVFGRMIQPPIRTNTTRN